MHADVKPLTHWLIYKGYKVRFRQRQPHLVQGVLTMPEGEAKFTYEPGTMTIRLPNRTVTIDRYGRERTQGSSCSNDEGVDERDR